MKKTIEKIGKEWNEPVGVPFNQTPTITNGNLGLLMCNLLDEEVNELRDAVIDQDMTEIADALGDICYLLFGTVCQYGLSEQFENIVNEIHNSNLSKKENGAYLLREDGKVLKGKNYYKPNIKKFLK